MMKTRLPDEFLTPMRIAVVGCGGIGDFLVEPMVRFLEYTPQLEDVAIEVYLLDPDKAEERNLERQATVKSIGRNKALALAERVDLAIHPKRVHVTGLPIAVSPKQGMRTLKELFWDDGIIVMGCVDEHVSRVYIQELMANLRSGIFICGGNDFHDGQVQLWTKHRGKESAQIHKVHPEMTLTSGRFPDEPSCQVGAEKHPQLIWANMACALAMGAALWHYVRLGLEIRLREKADNEIHFDLSCCTMQSVYNIPVI
jgi:hypothetical protein